ncbi:MAG: type II toxin-antitoxin system HicA family toxin [Opitutales bacterium]|nr:type II toxin-antitoxin system HicA family toxin [Opitutales bacterium]
MNCLDPRGVYGVYISAKSGDVIKKLKVDGWFLVHVKGSHQQFKHPTKTGRVTVPHPKKDLPIGTVKAIAKQAGIKL